MEIGAIVITDASIITEYSVEVRPSKVAIPTVLAWTSSGGNKQWLQQGLMPLSGESVES